MPGSPTALSIHVHISPGGGGQSHTEPIAASTSTPPHLSCLPLGEEEGPERKTKSGFQAPCHLIALVPGTTSLGLRILLPLSCPQAPPTKLSRLARKGQCVTSTRDIHLETEFSFKPKVESSNCGLTARGRRDFHPEGWGQGGNRLWRLPPPLGLFKSRLSAYLGPPPHPRCQAGVLFFMKSP